MRRVLMVAALLLPGAVRAADLTVTDAFSRATPGTAAPGVPPGTAASGVPPGTVAPGVAYLTIHGGDTADRLLRVGSPVATVQMHEMAMQGEVMRMREVEGIDVPAGGTVRLAPGGLHLMLMGLKAPLKQGGTVPLVLTFAHAGERRVEVPVGGLGATMPPVR